MSTIRFWDTCFLRLDALCELQERISEFNDRFGNFDPREDSERHQLRQEVRFNNSIIEGVSECLSRIGMTCHTLVLLVQTVISQVLRAGYFFVLGACTLDYRQFVYGFLDLASVVVQLVALSILSLGFLCLPVSCLEKVREKIRSIIQSHDHYSFDPLEATDVDGEVGGELYSICGDLGGREYHARRPYVPVCGRRIEMDAFSHETQRVHVVVMSNGVFKPFTARALIVLNNLFCVVKVIAIDIPFELIKAIFRGDISKLLIFAVVIPFLFIVGLVSLVFLPFFPRDVRREGFYGLIGKLARLDWILSRNEAQFDLFYSNAPQPGKMGYDRITFAEHMLHIHFKPTEPMLRADNDDLDD